MPMMGTMQNPLTVQPGAIVADEQRAAQMQALAQQMAQQQLQAGPNNFLNVLTPFVQQFAANRQGEKAAKLIGETAQKRFELDDQLASRAEERELLRGEKLAQARREAWLKAHPGDNEGAEIVAMTGKPPPKEKAQGLLRVGDQVYDPVTRKVVYDAPDKPQAPRAPTDIERRIELAKAAGATPEQIQALVLGSSAPSRPAPPSGMRWTADGSAVEPIPGAPPKAPKGPTAEAANKLAQWENALREARAYRAAVVDGEGDFGDIAARMPENARRLDSAIRGKLRGESGATITPDEIEGEQGRYGPRLMASDTTNVAAIDRMITDLENQIATVGGAGTAQGQVHADAPAGGAEVGKIIDVGGKKYRIVGGDPNDPDVEPVG